MGHGKRVAQFGRDFQVNLILIVDHFFDGEIFFHKGRAGLAQPPAERRIAGELQQSPGGGIRVPGADDKSGDVFEADLLRPVKIVGDDRFAGGERLRQGAGQRLAIGKVRQTIHHAHV